MKYPSLHAIAKTDIRDATYYYEQQRKGLGKNFLNEVYQYIEKIAENPLSNPLLFGNVRRCVLKRFPYNLLYRIRKDGGVRVLSITHQHRQLNNLNRH